MVAVGTPTDPLGNRTSKTGATGTTSDVYDAADQLTSVTPTGPALAYGYDGNGNETTAGPWQYAFNLVDQLTAALNGTTAAGPTTSYLWDPNFPLPQLASSSVRWDTVNDAALETRYELY